MRIEYFGHSCFLFTARNGLTLLTDPYDETVGYRLPNRRAEVTLVSHDHWDHNHVAGVAGKTRVLTGAQRHEVRPDLVVVGVLAAHDEVWGTRFGWVTLFHWTMDNLRVAFLSDLGHALEDAQLQSLGPVDIVLVPVGGHYTLDALGAKAVIRQLPTVRLVIPMHYMTPSLARQRFPIAGVEPFLDGYSNIRRVRSGDVVVETLPDKLEILVLTPMN